MQTRDYSDAKPTQKEPIAITGIGCRFPGADGPEAFWKLLREGVDAIGEVPPDRFHIDEVYDPTPGVPGKIASRLGGFLERADQFDASFFHISPREALRMDPQQRILLEVVWESLEDAGQIPEKLAASATGIFIGACTSDYEDLQYYLRDPEEIDLYVSTGTARSVISGRVSYVFDLRGPSLTIDTACSSSLVAVHLACQSLWWGECSVALAGGVNLALLPEITMSFSRAKMIAPQGRCRFGDTGAEGFIRSDGVGVVVLKPLSQARKDGDRIYALIRGSAVNNDGRSSGLLATPSREGQQAVLRRAYLNAGISPGDVHYVESHGTGTSVGDPIEVESLGAVLADGRPKEDHCRIGSVKSNIGHTEGAAGIAGLIKVALCLEHRMIPQSLHFKTPNPNIPWQELPVEVSQGLIEWPSSGPAIAGVSAFGISGTNAHIVLEESTGDSQERNEPAGPNTGAQLMTLSARSAEALVDLAQSYSRMNLDDSVSLRDICYTANVRRSHHDHRLAMVVRSHQEMVNNLKSFLRSEVRPGISRGQVTTGSPHRLVFVFSGQGSQWFGMGRGLLAEPAFREAMERCDRAIRQYTNWSVLDEMTVEESESRLDRIEIAQPYLFAIQVSLAAMWRSWGIEPDAVVGQSMGEVAAAHIAGALSLEDAAKVICRRSLLLKRLSGQGGMLVVGLSLDKALAAIAGYDALVSVAASSSPNSTVLSGDTAALEEIIVALHREGVFSQPVKVDVASHSPLVEPLREDLLNALRGVTPEVASTPIYSTVTGGAMSEGLLFDADYWVRNLREPVLFSSTIEKLIGAGHDIFVEVSPHPVLLTPIQQIMNHLGRAGTVLPSMRCGEAERPVMLGSFGALYSAGLTSDFDSLYPSGGRLVRLPTYPWQRERFWLGAERSKRTIDRARLASRCSASSWQWSSCIRSAVNPGTYFLEVDLGPDLIRRLNDHRVQGAAVLPGAVYIDLVLAAAANLFGDKRFALEDLQFKKALFLADGELRLQLIISSAVPGRFAFQFYRSQPEDCDELGSPHATGVICIDDYPVTAGSRSPEEIKGRCSEQLSQLEFYRLLVERGLEYGPGFQGVSHIWSGEDEAFGRIFLPGEGGTQQTSLTTSALFDACFQTLAATIRPASCADECGTYLPVGLESLRIYGDLLNTAFSYGCLRTKSDEDRDLLKGVLLLLDESGQVLAEAQGIGMRRLDPALAQGTKNSLDKLLYETVWRPSALRRNHSHRLVPDQRGAWIVFADQHGIGESLVRSLESCGETCVIVLSGEAFLESGNRYRINPRDTEDYRRLFQQVGRTLQQPLLGIVHLWSLDAPVEQVALNEAAYEGGCGSVLLLVQTAAKAFETTPFRLWLVTSNAQQVGAENSPLSIVQSPLWGLGRVIGHEYPELRCTLIDLDRNPSPEDTSTLLTELLESDRETQIAFRGDSRYVCRLTRYPAASALPRPDKSEVQLRADGTYLITGGFGGLGLTVARWMVERGARHLVLVGRSDPSTAVNETLSGLREKARVVVVKADVSRLNQVADLMAVVDSSMLPLRGIVHSAGVLDDGILLQMDAERFKKVMAPKIAGAWNLHTLTLNRELDFFVSFSSAASLLGPAGQANYSAANAFLDALSHYRRSLGLPGLTINWGRWSDVGLAARPDRTRRLEMRGIRSFTPDQGLQALNRLLVEGATQAGVMTFDFEDWSEFYPTCRELPFFAELKEPSKKSEPIPNSGGQKTRLTREKVLDLNHEDRLGQIQSYLGRQLACVLAVSSSSLAKLDINQPLNRFGVDSLMAVELRSRIEGDLGVTIPVVNFLKGSSTAQLAGQVLEVIAAVSLPNDVQEEKNHGFCAMIADDQMEEITL